MKTSKTVKLIAFLLVAIMLASLCACGSKDDTKTPGGAQTEFGSLLDYAKKLEEAGNAEAAAAVYEIVIKNGGAGLIGDAREDDLLIQAADEADSYRDLLGDRGGDER